MTRKNYILVALATLAFWGAALIGEAHATTITVLDDTTEAPIETYTTETGEPLTPQELAELAVLEATPAEEIPAEILEAPTEPPEPGEPDEEGEPTDGSQATPQPQPHTQTNGHPNHPHDSRTARRACPHDRRLPRGVPTHRAHRKRIQKTRQTSRVRCLRAHH